MALGEVAWGLDWEGRCGQVGVAGGLVFGECMGSFSVYPLGVTR